MQSQKSRPWKLLLLTVLFASPAFAGEKQEPALDLMTCENEVFSPFRFGQAATGCDISKYEDEKAVLASLNDVIFNQNASSISQETKRYVTNLYRFIRDSSDAYYRKRNPEASQEELAAFQRALFALIHQESFWSHYRISNVDKAVKILKGDRNAAFGMTQINILWHKNMLIKFRAWNIIGNLLYGMDMFYRNWQQAAKLDCVGNLEQRARAAYSLFNSGSKGCRWTNEKDAWAKNDIGYHEKWTKETWKTYLLETSALPSNIDPNCVVENGTNCAK